jgi:uncharacterized protein YjiS (DUF1127 family)
VEIMSTIYSECAGDNRVSPLHAGASTLRLLSGLKSIIAWPVRVLAARRELELLAGMSEYELKDIGLTRSDLGDATALPADASPTDFLAARVEERHRAKIA